MLPPYPLYVCYVSKFFFLILFFLSICCLIYGIGLHPTRYIFFATHNEILEGDFVVVNEHESDIPIFIEIHEGIKSIENKTLPPVHQWLKIEDKNFVLPPKGTKKVNFKVVVPTGTAGTFSGRISFVDKSQSAFLTSITVPIYIIIKGTEIIDWSVEELNIKNTPVGLSGSFVIKY